METEKTEHDLKELCKCYYRVLVFIFLVSLLFYRSIFRFSVCLFVYSVFLCLAVCLWFCWWSGEL